MILCTHLRITATGIGNEARISALNLIYKLALATKKGYLRWTFLEAKSARMKYRILFYAPLADFFGRLFLIRGIIVFGGLAFVEGQQLERVGK